MLSNTNLPVLGLLILVFATWTTATSSAYAGGIAGVNVLKLKDDKRAMLTLILGIVGIGLAAGGIIDHFVEFLELFDQYDAARCRGSRSRVFRVLQRGRRSIGNRQRVEISLESSPGYAGSPDPCFSEASLCLQSTLSSFLSSSTLCCGILCQSKQKTKWN